MRLPGLIAICITIIFFIEILKQKFDEITRHTHNVETVACIERNSRTLVLKFWTTYASPYDDDTNERPLQTMRFMLDNTYGRSDFATLPLQLNGIQALVHLSQISDDDDEDLLQNQIKSRLARRKTNLSFAL